MIIELHILGDRLMTDVFLDEWTLLRIWRHFAKFCNVLQSDLRSEPRLENGNAWDRGGIDRFEKNSSEVFLSIVRIVIDFCTIIIAKVSTYIIWCILGYTAQLHNNLQTTSGDESSGDFMFDKIQNLLLRRSGVLQAMATVSQVSARDA